MLRRLVLVALVLPLLGAELVVVHAEEPPPRFEYEGLHGVYRFHGRAPRAGQPVLVAEPGVAKPIWDALTKHRQPFVLVETRDLTPYARLRDNGRQMAAHVEQALCEAAGIYRGLPQSPWIAIGHGASAVRMARVVFMQGRWQGLALLGTPIGKGLVPADKARHGDAAVLLAQAVPGGGPEWTALREGLDEVGVAYDETPLHANAATEISGASALAAIRFAARRLKTKPAFREPTRVGDRTRTAVTVAKDVGGIEVTGDLYSTGDKSKPVILLCHQARSSRGEYVLIAPRLVAAGYNCLALDQRSGDHWSGLRNATAARAARAELPAAYIDARPDIDAAITYLRAQGFAGPMAVVGSSYSSSLAVFIGAENDAVRCVVSFSPGDYLPPRGSILEAAKKHTKPILIVCPPREEAQARQVFGPLAAEAKELYVQPSGIHGASTLYRSRTHAEAWARFTTFLGKHLK